MGDPAQKSSGRKHPQSRKGEGSRKARGADGAIPAALKGTGDHGANRTEPVRATSKSEAIRAIARDMVAKGQPPRPKEIIAALRNLGITVLSSQVTTALRDTDFALRQFRVDWERPPVLFPEPALALSLVSLDDVFKAKKFVADLGGIEKAKAALVALVQFGGEAKTGPRPVNDDGELVALEEPARMPPDDTKGS